MNIRFRRRAVERTVKESINWWSRCEDCMFKAPDCKEEIANCPVIPERLRKKDFVVSVAVETKKTFKDGDTWLCTIPLNDRLLAYGVARRFTGNQYRWPDKNHRQRAKGIALQRAQKALDNTAFSICLVWVEGQPILPYGYVSIDDIKVNRSFLEAFNQGDFDRGINE